MMKGRLTLISVNSFQTLPPVKQFFDHFRNNYFTTIIHCTISNYENSFSEAEHHTLLNFNDNRSFLNQSKIIKVKKYFNLISKFFANILFKNEKNQIHVLVAIELFPLLLCLIFKRRNQVLIYHQFEMVKPELINKFDKICLNLIKRIVNKLDIIIIPEVNRINYFKSILGRKVNTSYFLLPNTNDNSIKLIKGSDTRKKIIAHIGSIGEDSFIKELLEAFKIIENDNIELWIIGSLDANIIEIFKCYDLKNIVLIGHLNHSELIKKYEDIDIGLVLYRGNDLNTLYCAPNKLYEYWSFGIPVIGHKLPGLLGVFNKNFMGSVIDMSQPKEIVTAIRMILCENHKNELSKYFGENLKANIYYKNLDNLINSKFNTFN